MSWERVPAHRNQSPLQEPLLSASGGLSWRAMMRKSLMLVRKLVNDEDGAALVEYTVLLGIMLVAVVATIVAVGGWVGTKWTALNTALAGH